MKRLGFYLPITPPLVVVYVIAVFCMGVCAAYVGDALAAWWLA